MIVRYPAYWGLLIAGTSLAAIGIFGLFYQTGATLVSGFALLLGVVLFYLWQRFFITQIKFIWVVVYSICFALSGAVFYIKLQILPLLISFGLIGILTVIFAFIKRADFK